MALLGFVRAQRARRYIELSLGAGAVMALLALPPSCSGNPNDPEGTSSGESIPATGGSSSTKKGGSGGEGGAGIVCPTDEVVLDGDVVIDDLRDLDALAGVTRIRGNLVISGTLAESLDALACLERVDGNLVIVDNPNLQSLDGLASLESVGGNLEIHGNGKSLAGLDSLLANLTVGGDTVLERAAVEPDRPDPKDAARAQSSVPFTNVQPGTALTVDTAWTLAGSPYVIGNDVFGMPAGAGDLTINAGVTLTIEPGVEVQFASGDTDREIVVNGTLIANGTAMAPIVFRHATSTSAGAWEGLRFAPSAVGRISNAIIRHADYGIEISSPTAANYTLSNITFQTYTTVALNLAGTGTINLSNLTIDSPGQYGIIGSSMTVTVSNSTVSNVATGMSFTSSTATVTGCTLTGGASTTDTGIASSSGTLTLDGNVFKDWNTGANLSNNLTAQRNVFWGVQSYGLFFNSSYALTGNHNTFYGQTNWAIYNSAGSPSLNITRNVFGNTVPTSNGTIGSITESLFWGPSAPSATGTNLRADALFKNPAMGDFTPTERSPARWWAPTTPSEAAGATAYAGDPSPAGFAGAYYADFTFPTGSSTVTGDILIHPNATLTFLPGTTIRFTRGDSLSGMTTTNRAEIYVAGELESDGTVSNFVTFTSAEASPAPGDWTGLVLLQTTPSFNVSETSIRYATNAIDLRTSSHIIQNATIDFASNAGILIQGGSPTLTGIRIANSTFGISSSTAQLTLTDVEVTGSTNYGIYIAGSGTSTFTDVDLVSNGTTGLYGGLYYQGSTLNYTNGSVTDNRHIGLYIPSASTATFQNLIIARNSSDGVWASATQSHTHNTIVRNGGNGINRASGSVTLNSTSITHNTGAGVSGFSGSCTDSNTFGNGSGGALGGTNCFVYNPLYADIDAYDYRPTSRSPNRLQGTGGYIGALPYAGQLTGPLMGFFWDPFTFTTGSHQIPGDIVIPSGRTVNVQPGVVFLMKKNADDMGGGTAATRVEVAVRQGATLAIDGSGAPIRFTSDSASPAPGDWIGIVISDGGTSPITNSIFEYPSIAVNATGPSVPRIEDVEIFWADGAGLNFSSASSSTNNVDVNRVAIIGKGTGSPSGVVVSSHSSATARIRNVYATHHGTGYGINVTTTSTTDIVNCTLVTQQYGIGVGQGTFNISNNLIVNSKVYGIFNQFSASFTDNYRNNMVFSSYPGSAAVLTTSGWNVNSNNQLTVNPLIEDDDWQELSFPRWWDGAVWQESLAVNTGLASAPSIPTVDITGKPRVIGANPDIGAFEFDPTANREPRADAVTSPVLVPWNEPVTLNGSGAVDPDGTIQTAYWTVETPGNALGSAAIVAGLSPTYTFPTSGNDQFAFLTIIDDDGAADHRRVTFNVDKRPIANAGVDVYANTGEQVNFNDASNDADGTITTYSWNFGDGTPTSNLQNPSHVYSSAGVYTVTLTVTDNLGLTAVDTTLAHITGGADSVGPNIQHTEIADGRLAGQGQAVVATIQDTSGVAGAFVSYRAMGSTAAPTVSAMTRTSGDALNGTYSFTIPGAAVTTAGVEYWIDAEDTEANASTLPINAPTGVFNFLVVAEQNPPSIVHTEISDGQIAGSIITVQATISDATGVGQAFVYYRTTGSGVFTPIAMTQGAANLWSAQIPGSAVVSPGIQYYIQARDSNSVPNQATSPTGAPTLFYDFSVIGGPGGDTTPPAISHTPIANGQTAAQAVTITASITDGAGVSAATVFYRTTGMGSYTQLSMVRISGNTWQAQIPGTAVTTAGVQYYITATDPSNNVGRDPATAPAMVHAFTVVMNDTTGPVIVHTPITNGQAPGMAVLVQATVTDASGLSYVRLRYRRQGGVPTFGQVDMVNTTGNVWQGSIPAIVVGTPGVDYWLEARDNFNNLTRSPSNAPTSFYSFTVGAGDNEGPTITHTPIPGGQPAGNPVTVAASITDASGVGTVQLAYRRSGQPTFSFAPMSNTGGSAYEGTIPAVDVTVAGVDYYISATDSANPSNTSYSPPTAFNTFTVTPADTSGPVISHSPVNSVNSGQSLIITANVTDPSGIGTVNVVWVLDSGSPTTTALAHTTGDTYSATIPAASIPNGTVTVYYYLTATDTRANQSRLPSNMSSFGVTVVYPDTTPPTVSIGTITQPHPEGTPLNVTINASDAGGIGSVTLYYRPTGSGPYSTVAATGSGPYSATIPGAATLPPSLQIYAEAVDTSSNTSTTAVQTVTIQPAPDTTPPTIVVTDVEDGQLAGSQVAVFATITDADSTIQAATLFYRLQGQTAYSQIAMSNGGGGDVYRGNIPGSAVVQPAVEYYVTARDAANNTATEPDAASPLSFTVSTVDSAGPTIAHDPASGPLSAGAPYLVTATITDSTGVASATLYFRTQGSSSWSSGTAMTAGANNTYTATIASPAVPGVEYYIRAVDTAGTPNESFSPANAPGGFHGVPVTVLDTTGPNITHTEVADGQPAGQSIDIQATVTDATGVASVVLFYRTTGTSSFTQLAMSASGGDVYTVTLPGSAVDTPGIDYYILATDTATAANTRRLPANAPTSVLSFTVLGGGGDTQPPMITHQPVTMVPEVDIDIPITATVTDSSGIDSVELFFRETGNSTWGSVAMDAEGNGVYSGDIPADVVRAAGVEYYIEATDASPSALTSTAPADAPTTVYSIEVGHEAPPVIDHTPLTDDVEVGTEVEISAVVTDDFELDEVTLFFRATGRTRWTSVPMTLGSGDTYSVMLESADVVLPGIEYYIEATDTEPGLTTTAPDDAPDTFYGFAVVEGGGGSGGDGGGGGAAGDTGEGGEGGLGEGGMATGGTAGSGGTAGGAGLAGSAGMAGSGAKGSGNGPDADEDSGCGCRVPGSQSGDRRAAGFIALAALGIVFARRRRSRPLA